MTRLATVLMTGAVVAGGVMCAAQADPSPAATSDPLPTYFSLPASAPQLVTVTSSHWSDTQASMKVWRKRDDTWSLVRGPVPMRLGWSGWVPGGRRRQDSGTTPAGRFAMPYAFGNRADPGAALSYRHVDGNDVWPYEPRDPATYNICQPHRARTSHWRTDYRERLGRLPHQYAHAIVLGFNLPSGVHWSHTRHQYVARDRADTRRGGGIFLHVRGSGPTAGCVAGRLSTVRWLVRWLDPDLHPRIVMGPKSWAIDHL
jgi:L,D-peptidoglycan transpeptidase YkuD (ErfK/YbiS/YcfS/YnhG family)